MNQLRNKAVKFSIINARSITTKIPSLTTNFEEMEWDFALITETWLRDDHITDDVEENLRKGHGLHMICQHREGKTGGGVAIVFRKSKLTMKRYTFRKDGCEIVAGRGKLVNNRCPLFLITAYIPPGLRVRETQKYYEAIRNLITKIKTEERNLIIIMGGDFNNYNLTLALEDFLDFECCLSPATRGDE